MNSLEAHMPLLIRFGRWQFLLGALAFVLVVLGVLNDLIVEFWRIQWFVFGGLGLGQIYFLRRVLRYDWLSPAVVYAGILWAFHFGLVFPVSLIPAILDDTPFWAVEWLYTPETTLAVTMSLLFMTCFILGTSLFPSVPRTAMNSARRDVATLVLGWLLIAGGWGLFLFEVSYRGMTVFLLPYESFFPVSNTFAYSLYLIGYGLVLHLSAGMKLRDVLVISIFFYFPLVMLMIMLGSRTSAMFSLVVLAVILAKRGFKLNTLTLLIFVLFSLALIGTTRELRRFGIGVFVSGQSDLAIQSPITGLSELGGSLRPVYASIDYLKFSDYSYGETYLYPFFRQIARLAGESAGTVETDRRFIAMHINLIYGAIGYSTVAEAYINGGIIGVILFSFLWGVILRILDLRARDSVSIGFLGGVLLPMLINIRNSFIYVPAWIFMVVCVLTIAVILRGVQKQPSLKESSFARSGFSGTSL